MEIYILLIQDGIILKKLIFNQMKVQVRKITVGINLKDCIVEKICLLVKKIAVLRH